jgi:hypothetical protein
MKGIHGLIVAIGLGLAGVLLNLAYLHNRSKDVDPIHFIGIKPEESIGPGERLLRDQLVAVPIPRNRAGNLEQFAVKYAALETVVDRHHAPRLLEGGSLLLQSDLAMPRTELKLAEREVAWPIPVDRSVVASLIMPDDLVWFLGPRAGISRPTPGIDPHFPDEDPDPPESSAPADPPAEADASLSPGRVGPFVVLALGNRLSSPEAMRAARIRPVQENVILIKVKTNADGSLEPLAEKLWELLETTGQPLSIQWRPRKSGGK